MGCGRRATEWTAQHTDAQHPDAQTPGRTNTWTAQHPDAQTPGHTNAWTAQHPDAQHLDGTASGRTTPGRHSIRTHNARIPGVDRFCSGLAWKQTGKAESFKKHGENMGTARTWGHSRTSY